MVDGWISGLFETFVPVHTNFRPVEQGRVGGMEGSGWRWQASSQQWQQVHPIGAILITVTSQGQQNAFQKSTPAHIRQ